MADQAPKAHDREPGRADVEHREDALDEALAASFPASDPPAMIRASRQSKTMSPPPDTDRDDRRGRSPARRVK